MTNILYKKWIMNFQELAIELANVRKNKNISQRIMAEALHLSRATISNFENGSGNDIGLKKVIQIADYLGLELHLKEKSPFPVFEDIING